MEPVRLPQAQLRLGHAGHLTGRRALHAAEEDVVRLLPVPVLRQRETGAGHVAVATLSPQPDQGVSLAQEPVELRERVEAPRLLRVADHVVLQERHGDVPRVVGLTEELDEFTRNLRLRLRQRDALQQRLHHVGTNSRLPLVVLLG